MMELLKIEILLLHISTVLSTGVFVRLVNGNTPNQGRVEIYHNGEWGTICDDNFGYNEARAVCSALGYRNGSPFASAHFGRGTGSIFVDDLHCDSTGHDIHILVLGTTRCSFRGWGTSNCGHGEDVGVECESVRLVNGTTPNQGRVEIYHNGEWGTICDDNFGNNEARAVCRALDYRDGIPFRRAYFGRGTGRIFVDNLNCHSFHSSTYHVLQLGRVECSFRGWGVSYCNHGNDVGVACKGSLGCGEGQFGYSCGSRCHCKIPRCNSITGVCDSGDCLPGWRGTSCSVACPSGTFGQSCTSRCHCRNSGCDPVTGVCTDQSSGCDNGWRGVNCDQECDGSKFGYSCRYNCHCKVPGCDRTTGACKMAGCLPGWRGPSCSKVCSPGTFGQSCTSRCNCRIFGCNPVTGVCTHQESGCLAGWRGVRCDEGCSFVTFGQSCSSKCYCRSLLCDPITGVCRDKASGCLGGWTGKRCDQEEEQDSNTVGYKVAVSLLAVLLALAVILIVGVCVKFKRMKRKNNNSTTENTTRETDANRGLFAIALPRQEGLQDLARIGQGNVAFHGAQVDIHFDGFERNQRHNNNKKA